MKKYTLSIPEPCGAALQDMPKTEMGRFCHDCQKQVVDFSNMTDRQIITYFEKHGNCCGMLHPSQLNRDIVAPAQSRTWMPAAVFAGMLAMALPETGKAQQSVLTGVVKDSASGQPIPGATISIPATTIAAYANKDGMFVLQLPKNYSRDFKLVSSYIGYQSKEIQVTGDTLTQPIQVNLQPAQIPDTVLVIAGGIQLMVIQENWWQRLKRKLFR